MTIDCAQEKLGRESRQGGDERESLKMAVRAAEDVQMFPVRGTARGRVDVLDK